MQIGPLHLKSNLFLSPLAGYTNLPFRLTLREIGGLDLATTDLVNARSLLERNPKALKLIESRPADRPLAVQLFGSVPEEMRDAAIRLEEAGVAAVDINMGCPVRKICRVGGGSSMMTDMDKTARLVRGMVEAVKIPVTAKMRLGWDDQNLTAPRENHDGGNRLRRRQHRARRVLQSVDIPPYPVLSRKRRRAARTLLRGPDPRDVPAP
jgi:tRNA-dihydrouridine synthase B